MYKVEIKESTELTKKQSVAIKDSSNAIKLDEATKEAALILKPVGYAVLSVHNDKSDDKDYEQYVVIDDHGQTYVTGSASFFTSFYNIWSEMLGEEEEWELKVFRSPSKNYVGRDFITCAIL